MKIKDLLYIISPLQHVVIIDRNFDNVDFDEYDILYSGMWYRMHGVKFNMEVIDMYEAIHDLTHCICLEVRYVSDFTEDDVS